MAGGVDDREQPPAPDDPETLQPFQVADTLGRYRILRKIGSGGMGEVYTAEDPSLNRQVAIKVLPRTLASNKEVVHRFEREAQAIAKLEHPNIVTIYSVEHADGVEFITMQLVEGETLGRRVPRRGVPLYEFFDLAIQMADGISSAHERGIVHRDLKPDNIIVSDDERVMILDFGLAKLREEVEPRGLPSSRRNLTSEGALIGTLDYMSPEQAEGKPIDHRSDIFSLGIILYELVTGEHPFKGDSSISVISSIVKDAPKPITDINPSLPRHLDRILRLALEKNREHRFQSTKDLRNELESLKREVSSIELATATARPSRSLLARSYGIGAVCGLLAAAATAWLFGWFGADELQVEFGDNRRIAGDAALEVHPAISPSGKMVAYARGSAGQRRLYVRHVAGGKPVALTAEFAGNHLWPQWSPDESQIAFESEGRRWLVSPFPGDRRELEGATGSGGMAWSPDGRQIAFVRDSTLIVRPSAGGADIELVTTLGPNSPSWSPDGGKIAFVSGNWQYLYSHYIMGNIAPSSIWIVPAGGGDPVEVIADGSLNACPLWLDDRHLLFLSDKHGSNDIYLLRVDGDGQPVGAPRRLSTGLDAHSFSLSTDRRQIAYSEFTTRANIWRLPVPESDLPASNRDAVQVTFGSQVVEGVGISRDGKILLFDSNRGGNQDIYKLALPAGEPKQLTVDPAADFLPEFSPSGDEIAFYSFRTGNRDLHVMAPDGTGVTQITTTPSQDRYPYWSPDGNSLVYYSDATGREELWVVSREQRGAAWGEPRQLTKNGGQYGRWSPDGETIAYARSRGCWLVPAAGGEPRELADAVMGLSRLPFVNWAPDGETIYVKSWDREGRSTFWAIPAGGDAPRQLVVFDDPSKPSGRGEFATDGVHFYFTVAEQLSDVFTLELKAR